MERPLLRVLLWLFLLGCTARKGRRDTTRLDPYGAPLLDDPAQRPAHLNASGESSLDQAQTSPTGPGKTGGGHPPAEETSRSCALLSGVSAGEVTRFSAKESADTVVLMEGEQCNKWVPGKASPVETFPCPTQSNQREMFCCGTCTASYCCSSPKKHLDQESCPEIIKKAEDRKAALFTVTPPQKSINNTRLVLAVIGISCIGAWIVMVVSYFQDQKTTFNQQTTVYETLDVEGEHPVSRRAASGDPDPSPLVAEESQRSSESPMAVATSSGCPGSPMEQDTAV